MIFSYMEETNCSNKGGDDFFVYGGDELHEVDQESWMKYDFPKEHYNGTYHVNKKL